MVLWVHTTHFPNGILIDSTVLQGSLVCPTQTDTQTQTTKRATSAAFILCYHDDAGRPKS